MQNLVSGRRSLHGERGLKLVERNEFLQLESRSLHGERGLKRRTTSGLHRSDVAPFTGSVD